MKRGREKKASSCPLERDVGILRGKEKTMQRLYACERAKVNAEDRKNIETRPLRFENREGCSRTSSYYIHQPFTKGVS